MTAASWPELERFITDVTFAQIVEADSRRTLYVLPADVDRARWHVEQAGAERLITVEAHPYLPDGTWLLVDLRALEASQAEYQQRLRYQPPWKWRLP